MSLNPQVMSALTIGSANIIALFVRITQRQPGVVEQTHNPRDLQHWDRKIVILRPGLAKECPRFNSLYPPLQKKASWRTSPISPSPISGNLQSLVWFFSSSVTVTCRRPSEMMAHWCFLTKCQLYLQVSTNILSLMIGSVAFWPSLLNKEEPILFLYFCFLSGPQEGCLSSVTYASMIPLQMLQNYLRLVGGHCQWRPPLPSCFFNTQWPILMLIRVKALAHPVPSFLILLLPLAALSLAGCLPVHLELCLCHPGIHFLDPEATCDWWYNLGSRRLLSINKYLASNSRSSIWKGMAVHIKMLDYMLLRVKIK